ncbi:MAG: hypothetical protein D6678_07045 [Zetaproteobacteria bacterium]|nr:MAG: hypothetical protein D6678_07045 [Zetaproteobacteria bacterium]
MLPLLLLLPWQAVGGELTDYLYYRDVNVPPYQKLREFFDMPDRPGRYEVTMFSDAFGPLTFRVLRVRGESEVQVTQQRSWRVENHEFQYRFHNHEGKDDLIVEVANSNPVFTARISVYVVELP